MEKPRWNNTFDSVSSKKIWANIHDAILTTAAIGYKYMIWDDGRIVTYSSDKHGVLVVEPTDWTIADIEIPQF